MAIIVTMPELPYARKPSAKKRIRPWKSPVSAPVIHDRKFYRTKYDPGLGVGYRDYAERKQIIERINQRRAEKGEPKLMERGY